MARTQAATWVVYRMTIPGSATGVNAVCTQAEWEAMEAARPGNYPLLRAGIASENEAERLARGKSGDAVKQGETRSSGPADVPPAIRIPASRQEVRRSAGGA